MNRSRPQLFGMLTGFADATKDVRVRVEQIAAQGGRGDIAVKTATYMLE